MHLTERIFPPEPKERSAMTVYGSRHGEVGTTGRILQAVAAKEDISPTDFMLSVHNTTAGICSLAFKNEEPGSALAAGNSSLAASLIESLGILVESNDSTRVLCVFTDDIVPEPFVIDREEYNPVFGAAFLLQRSGAGGFESNSFLSMDWLDQSTTRDDVSERMSLKDFPQALSFICWLLRPQSKEFGIDLHEGGGRLSLEMGKGFSPLECFV